MPLIGGEEHSAEEGDPAVVMEDSGVEEVVRGQCLWTKAKMMIPEIKAKVNRWKNGVNLTADIPTAIAEKVVDVEEHEVLEVIGQDMSEEVAFVHQKKLEILA